MTKTENVLTHYGVLGMKWGVRRAEKKLSKMAKKDAEKMAVAKTAYGKGAGIQRRLVKTEIEPKLKDPTYKKYYDEAMANMDRSKIVNKAVTNSRSRAVKDQSVRSAKMVAKYLTGTTSLAAAFIFYQNNKAVINAFVDRAIKNAKRG